MKRGFFHVVKLRNTKYRIAQENKKEGVLITFFLQQIANVYFY
jgi:hypothetical protein